MKRKQKTSPLSASGASSQPPRNRSATSREARIMFPYSARKNIAKAIDEYSTLYPATSSASASGRSNGVRFVSATIEMKNRIDMGKRGNTNQTDAACMRTSSVRFAVPAIATTGRIARLTATSYAIICAAERRAPRNAYFELLAQPASEIQYTESPLIARIIRIP
jgi:CRISPR/Cas system-associated exonuclease Cas4 (RecB family)